MLQFESSALSSQISASVLTKIQCQNHKDQTSTIIPSHVLSAVNGLTQTLILIDSTVNCHFDIQICYVFYYTSSSKEERAKTYLLHFDVTKASKETWLINPLASHHLRCIEIEMEWL